MNFFLDKISEELNRAEVVEEEEKKEEEKKDAPVE